MGNVIGISPKHIRAASSPDGIPTFWVSGMVGVDFKGAALAQATEYYDEVRILLDSVGGYASDAFTFYDFVRVNKKKVHVEGYGLVASAATIIMAAAGRSRSALAPNAEYLIHNASGSDEEALSRYNDRMVAVYAELSGMSEREIRAIMKEDKAMSAQQAKKMKLVGTVLAHEAVAAQYTHMEENKETAPEVVETPETVEAAPVVEETTEVEQEIPVTVPQAIEAAIKGHIVAKVKVSTELSEALATATAELKAKATELDEVKAEADDLREKLSMANDAKANAEREAAEVKAKFDAITAELERIKAEPLVPAKEVKAEREVQVPGGGPSSTKQNKTTAQEDTMRESMDRWGFNKSKA